MNTEQLITGVFTRCVRVSGNLGSSYVFADDVAVDHWLKTTLPELNAKYGQLVVSVSDLPGLKVGDTCHVWGEADDVFTILKLIKYSPDRYGFLLDSGWSEEVAKCY